jgi:hypothetical protein
MRVLLLTFITTTSNLSNYQDHGIFVVIQRLLITMMMSLPRRCGNFLRRFLQKMNLVNIRVSWALGGRIDVSYKKAPWRWSQRPYFILSTCIAFCPNSFYVGRKIYYWENSIYIVHRFLSLLNNESLCSSWISDHKWKQPFCCPSTPIHTGSIKTRFDKGDLNQQNSYHDERQYGSKVTDQLTVGLPAAVLKDRRNSTLLK